MIRRLLLFGLPGDALLWWHAVSAIVRASSMKMVSLRLLCAVIVAALLGTAVHAQEVVKEWPAPQNPSKPATGLINGGDGAFYCFTNGRNEDELRLGEVIRITSDGAVTVVHSFGFEVGSTPSGIFLGADGNIYGVTRDGGNWDAGVFFRLTQDGELRTVSSPSYHTDELQAGLTQGDDGNFYGVSPKGGGAKRGAIFRVSPDGRRSVIASLSNLKTQGAYPRSTLLKGSGASLFGAAEKGGSGKGGVIFEVNTTGDFTVLYSFKVNEYHTPKLLFRGSDGALYGTAISRKSKKTQVFRIASGEDVKFWNVADVIGIAEGSDGHLYATAQGIRGDNGRIFRLTLLGDATQIFEFNSTNGSGPFGLTPLPEGGFIGVTRRGGSANVGTVFRLSLAGEHTLLYTFQHVRGFLPGGALTRGPEGNFYGTMQEGGFFGNGTIFRLTPEGEVTVLHSFNGTDGARPHAALLLASDGALYGTTEEGGSDDSGTIFKITPDAQFTSLFSFSWDFEGGGWPAQALIEGAGGTLFGTTSWGGRKSSGCVYAFRPGGAPQVIAHFPAAWQAGIDGCLVLGPDNNLYGLAQPTGQFGKTIFYRVAPTGGIKAIRSLSYNEGFRGTGLILGPDGDLYGTCAEGGNPSSGGGFGTIFRITTDGVLTMLKSFSLFSFEEGGRPSRLTLSANGNFYGAMASGGSNGLGYVFRLTQSGEFAKVGSFAGDVAFGDSVAYALVESLDGNLYGIANSDTIFRSLKQPRANRAPFVNNDYFFVGAKSTELSVLDNDGDADLDAFEIFKVTQGTAGTVQISDDKRSLIYKAGPNFTGEDRFNYVVRDSKEATNTGSVVVRGWSRLNATYSFALNRENGDVVGRLDLRLSGDGLFTGKAYLFGQVIPLRGEIDAQGIGYSTFNIRRESAGIGMRAVNLDAETFAPRLEGDFYAGAELFTFEGAPIAQPGNLEGRYTFLLDVQFPQPPGPAIPKGTGWGTMSANTDGSVIAKGQLPDGTPFSTGGWFSDPESWIFSASVGRRSLAYGKITFADIPQESDASGTLTWSTQATWRGPFTLGFDANQLRLIASRYVPQTGTLPLNFSVQPGQATVAIRDGDLTNDHAAEVTFTPNSAAFVSGSDLSSKLRVSKFGGIEGLWSGTFQHPDRPRIKRNFKGVVFQKTNRAGALFIDQKQTGSIDLVPK